MRTRLPAAALALAVLGATPRARALDPFEIQVYDGTANKPGTLGLELHLNSVATGYGTSTPPELPLRGQFHATLEPSFGLFPFWEIGAYLQTALRADHHYDYAGVKLRSKFVSPPSFDPNVRFGLNVEVSALPQAYDHDRFAMELRPIFAWTDKRWLIAVNPIVGVGLAGDGLHQGPTFEPAARISRSFAELVSVGAEYYGSIGPMASPLPYEKQIHQLFGVVDLEAFPALELELGLGGGVTPGGAGLIGKVILGTSFDLVRAAPKPAAAPVAPAKVP